MITTAMTKKMSKIFSAVLGAFVVSAMFTACTVDEKLCENDHHPHLSYVKFNYLWDKMPKAIDMTDENYVNTYILADRVVMHRWSSFNYSLKSQSGHYLTELPDGMAEEDNHDIEFFQIPSGEYKFLTMNFYKTFTQAENPDRIITGEYVITPDPLKGKQDMTLRLGAFTAEHVTYTYEEIKKKQKESPFGDFDEDVDTNPYTSAPEDASPEEKEKKKAKFIARVEFPLFCDSTTIRNIDNTDVVEVDFHPTTMTQNVDLYFDLKKKQTSTFQFYVDDVWCILSGVPRKMNIGTGAVDVSQTDKLIFQTKLVDANTVPDYDTPVQKAEPQPGNTEVGIYKNQSEDKVRCYANLNIPGLVENSVYTDANKYAGPGVLQIIVRVHYWGKDSNNNWAWISKTVMGRVNLHKNIERAQLLELAEDNNGAEYWRKAQDYKRVHLAIDATLDQSLITGADNSPRVANWDEEQHIEQDY